MRERLDLSKILNYRNADTIMKEIAQRVKLRRKEMRLTQEELSLKSGVSYGSIKRFETKGEISLHAILKIAIALECENDFDILFSKKIYRSMQEVIDEQDQESYCIQ